MSMFVGMMVTNVIIAVGLGLFAYFFGFRKHGNTEKTQTKAK